MRISGAVLRWRAGGREKGRFLKKAAQKLLFVLELGVLAGRGTM
jgi:hypothetical protein